MTTEPVVRARLSADPIDVEQEVVSLRRDDCGALVHFEGSVRSPSGGREVLRLEYEAYDRVVERQMTLIAEEVSRECGLRSAVVVHRTGSLSPGEIAILVVVVAPHRAAAFQGAARIVDRVKAEASIWKKEVHEGGADWIGCE